MSRVLVDEAPRILQGQRRTGRMHSLLIERCERCNWPLPRGEYGEVRTCVIRQAPMNSLKWRVRPP